MVIIPNASELGGLETWMAAEGTKAALSIGRSVECSTAMAAASAGAFGSGAESSSAQRSERVDRKRSVEVATRQRKMGGGKVTLRAAWGASRREEDEEAGSGRSCSLCRFQYRRCCW